MKRVASWGIVLFALGSTAWAAGKGDAATAFRKGEFPEITPAEWALTEVPFEPTAPAVVLSQIGTMTMAGSRAGQVSSSLVVTTRLKILSEAGLEYAEYAIPHSEDQRLTNIAARTVLPGGEVIPVPDDAIFRRESKLNVGLRDATTLYETAIAFPSVVPGAILDYSYELRFDWIVTDRWYFQTWIPTMHSEINYRVPNIYSIRPLPLVTVRREVQHEIKNLGQGREVRVWMDDIPSVAKEPLSFPFTDLASSFDLLFTKAGRDYIFEDWKTTCSIMEDVIYRDARRKDKKVREKAAELVAETTDPAAQAELLYAFVRDEIETTGRRGVWVSDTIDEYLEEGRASASGQAMMLQAMLEEVGIPARFLWARSRFAGMFRETDTGPWQFTRGLVAADLPGGTVYLDPSDPDLAFGRLHYAYDGTRALVYDRKDPELITLPSLSHEESVRHARIDLEVDEEGRVLGKGALTLTGHHAWRRIDWKDDDEETRKAWQEWLEDSFPDYEVTDLQIREADDNTQVDVEWTLAQNEDAVLGDEVTIVPSHPFGPQDQPFTLFPSRRSTPVLLSFPDRDELDVTVTYPEDWEVDVLPTYRDEANEAGSAVSAIEVDGEARSVSYRRTFDIVKREFVGSVEYSHIRKLFGSLERQDAQNLVLLQR